MDCPNCGLIYPPGTETCACGYDIVPRPETIRIPLRKRIPYRRIIKIAMLLFGVWFVIEVIIFFTTPWQIITGF